MRNKSVLFIPPYLEVLVSFVRLKEADVITPVLSQTLDRNTSAMRTACTEVNYSAHTLSLGIDSFFPYTNVNPGNHSNLENNPAVAVVLLQLAETGRT